MNVTHKNLEEVWNRLLELHPEKEDRRIIARELDAMLDELLWDDFFGTEGQNDPRGDRRDL